MTTELGLSGQLRTKETTYLSQEGIQELVCAPDAALPLKSWNFRLILKFAVTNSSRQPFLGITFLGLVSPQMFSKTVYFHTQMLRVQFDEL